MKYFLSKVFDLILKYFFLRTLLENSSIFQVHSTILYALNEETLLFSAMQLHAYMAKYNDRTLKMRNDTRFVRVVPPKPRKWVSCTVHCVIKCTWHFTWKYFLVTWTYTQVLGWKIIWYLTWNTFFDKYLILDLSTRKKYF